MSVVSPPIGWRVRYFESGDTRSAYPYVADVVETSPGGKLGLIIHSVGGGTTRRIRICRHASDALLKQNPEIARREGVWDWVPGMEYEPTKEEQLKAAESTVVKLYRQGHSVGDVAKHRDVKSLGVNKTDVENILRDRGIMKPAGAPA